MAGSRNKVAKAKSAVPGALANSAGNLSPVRLELLITIVDKKKAEFYTDLLQSFEVNLQLIKAATGTYKDTVMEHLGLIDNEKRVIFSIVRSDKLDEIQDALEDRFRSVKGGKGIAFSIPLSSIISLSAFGFLSNNLDIIGEAQG